MLLSVSVVSSAYTRRCIIVSNIRCRCQSRIKSALVVHTVDTLKKIRSVSDSGLHMNVVWFKKIRSGLDLSVHTISEEVWPGLLTPKKSDLGHFCLQCECHSHNVWILVLFKDTQSHEILENPSNNRMRCPGLHPQTVLFWCVHGEITTAWPVREPIKEKEKKKNEWRSKENQQSKICNFKSSHERKLLNTYACCISGIWSSLGNSSCCLGTSRLNISHIQIACL